MKNYILFLIIVIISGCKGNDEKFDYRDQYLGTFNFKTVSSATSMCQDSMSDCINHWRTWNFNTSQYLSKIEKIETNRLLMKLTENTISGYTDTLEIAPNGELSCSNFPKGGHYSFNGKYIGIDSINLNINIGGFNGGFQSYKINGYRIKH